MSTTAIRRGTSLRKRRSGTIREVAGFTTRPDGIRRARLVVPGDPNTPETHVRVDQLLKTYQPVE